MATISEKSPAQERIMEAAMRLFSMKGLCGASLREITEEAGVNLASINYHFGSKDGLIADVFRHYLEPINAARLSMLDAVESAAGDSPPPLESLLEAFIRPVVTHATRSGKIDYALLRLVGRCVCEPLMYAEKHVFPHFHAVTKRFEDALRRHLPGASREDIFWQLAFLAGALHFTLHIWGTDSRTLRPGKSPDVEKIVRRLIEFGAAGLRSQAARRDGEAGPSFPESPEGLAGISA